MSLSADDRLLRDPSPVAEAALSASERSGCGCLPMRDRSGWHRYHQVPMCDAAYVHARQKSRAKYERARPGARPYKPRLNWLPGVEIVLEEDAL